MGFTMQALSTVLRFLCTVAVAAALTGCSASGTSESGAPSLEAAFARHGANPQDTLYVVSPHYLSAYDVSSNSPPKAPRTGLAGNDGGVFELALDDSKYGESVLYSFARGNDGTMPTSGLALDAKGDLYG